MEGSLGSLKNKFDPGALVVDTRTKIELPEKVVAERTAHLSSAPSTGMA